MVVKACFQINTETIGLDLSQLLFSNRDGLLVVDDFLSEAEVGSKQSWIFWGNEWKHLLIVMCYVGGWNPQGNRWDSGCNGPGQGPRHILHHWPSTGSILSSLVKASQKKNLSFRYYPYWEAPPPNWYLHFFRSEKSHPNNDGLINVSYATSHSAKCCNFDKGGNFLKIFLSSFKV